MNGIWVIICLFCLVYGLITNRGQEMASAILSLPEEAFSLVLTLTLSATFWSGIMMIMYDAGLIDKLAKLLNPFLRLIMPNLNDEEGYKYISMNIAANIFGLGFAATPAGLKAMKRMKELSKEGEVASDEMVTFLIINTAGVTLFPMSVISLREKYGSSNPCDFLLITFIGTLCSCAFGLIVDVLFRKMARK